MRQIVLDTETTGLEAAAGHRVIEVGAVEFENRRPTGRSFHRYVNPERAVDPGALEVHGIDNEFLADQPVFADIADELFEFLAGAELIIHNADFDIGFLNYEFGRISHLPKEIRDHCDVLDTLRLARRMHPGQRNNLDALARRYHVDNSRRELHGALLDAQILAEVYLAMTGGQASLMLDAEQQSADRSAQSTPQQISREGLKLRVIRADAAELAAHDSMLETIRTQTGSPAIWREVEIGEPGQA
jgi:DNA polymerase-3 subunit epsilon